MIWFATLKSRGNHILFISAYKLIEIEAGGIFLKSRQDFSPSDSLKVQFPPVSTISAAFLGWETGKKKVQMEFSYQSWLCLSAISASEAAEILNSDVLGQEGENELSDLPHCLRQTSVINWIFCALWQCQWPKCLLEKQLPPGFYLPPVTTWGIFQNFAFPAPNSGEGMESSHVQSTGLYWWQDITWCNEEFLL